MTNPTAWAWSTPVASLDLLTAGLEVLARTHWRMHIAVVPAIVIYLLGAGLAIALWKRHPLPAGLALAASLIMLFNAVASVAVYEYLVRTPLRRMETTYMVIGALRSLISFAATAMLYVAVFVGRK